MRVTRVQRRVLSLIRKNYMLGSYFAPPGKWSLARFGHKSILVQGRTVRAMYRKGLIGGNIYWPYVTAQGWKVAGSR